MRRQIIGKGARPTGFHRLSESIPHRSLFVVSGEHDWALALIKQQLEKSSDNVIWLDHKAGNFDQRNKITGLLGTETDHVVYDIYYGFDPDTLGIVSGIIRGGGALVLITPPQDNWREYADPYAERFSSSHHKLSNRFLKRFIKQLNAASSPAVFINPENQTSFKLPQAITVSHEEDVPINQQQRELVEQIVHMSKSHKQRPLSVYADRGRGKSAALGLAAAQIIRQHSLNVMVTAPAKINCTGVFKHAASTLGCKTTKGIELDYANNWIKFLTPDEILSSKQNFDFLLVDEAAAIPVHILQKLLHKSSRCVFSTTVHGYEGSGRGFKLVFEKYLTRSNPGWKKVILDTPVRWRKNDSLESFIFDALLLKADNKDLPLLNLGKLEYQEITQDALAEDETLLSSVFSLLVSAHYKTRPYDLRLLLDSENIRVFIGSINNHLVCASIVVMEGPLPEELHQDIYLGKRRPRGHLLPQTLSYHCGLKNAPAYRYWRVMRIAVHESLRNQGIGQAIISYITQQASTQHADFIGTSFSANRQILGFWKHSGMNMVRLGQGKEQSTGEHAAVMLKALTANSQKMLDELKCRFAQSFVFSLDRGFKDLDQDIVTFILESISSDRSSVIEVEESDYQELDSFIEGNRSYEVVEQYLWKIAKLYLTRADKGDLLSPIQEKLLVEKIIENRDWWGLTTESGQTGRRPVLNELKKIFKLIKKVK